MLQCSNSERERFADFASLPLICRGVLRQIMGQRGMRPGAGSAADDDVRALSGQRPSVHPRVPLLIPITTETYLYAASEQIGALAALYTREEVLIGPLVLARSRSRSTRGSSWRKRPCRLRRSQPVDRDYSRQPGSPAGRPPRGSSLDAALGKPIPIGLDVDGVAASRQLSWSVAGSC
jgi:hypothetical protein